MNIQYCRVGTVRPNNQRTITLRDSAIKSTKPGPKAIGSKGKLSK